MQIPADDESLTCEQASVLLRESPRPTTQVRFHDTLFTVLKAKEIHEQHWSHATLRRLTVEARKSYALLYGDGAPVLDAYDDKSVVYLVAVQSLQKQADLIDNVYSARLTSASGQPTLTEDLNFYCIENDRRVPLIDRLTRSGIVGPSAESRIYSLSRICALKTQPGPRSLRSEHVSLRHSTTRVHWASISVGMMLSEFFTNHAAVLSEDCWISAQMSGRLSEQILRLPPPAGALPFPPAQSCFVSQPGIRLARHRDEVAHLVYRYPGYFLQLEQLAALLLDLIRKGDLSEQTVRSYLCGTDTPLTALTRPKIAYFRNLGALLTQDGPIAHSRLTGEEIRGAIDRHVADAPLLRLVAAPALSRATRELVRMLRGD